MTVEVEPYAWSKNDIGLRQPCEEIVPWRNENAEHTWHQLISRQAPDEFEIGLIGGDTGVVDRFPLTQCFLPDSLGLYLVLVGIVENNGCSLQKWTKAEQAFEDEMAFLLYFRL